MMANLSESILALLLTFLFTIPIRVSTLLVQSLVSRQVLSRFASMLANTPFPVAITTDVSTVDPKTPKNLTNSRTCQSASSPINNGLPIDFVGRAFMLLLELLSSDLNCSLMHLSYSSLNRLTDVSFSGGCLGRILT